SSLSVVVEAGRLETVTAGDASGHQDPADPLRREAVPLGDLAEGQALLVELGDVLVPLVSQRLGQVEDGRETVLGGSHGVNLPDTLAPVKLFGRLFETRKDPPAKRGAGGSIL